MNLTPAELRRLLRELVVEMGPPAAAMHWLKGCPEQPAPIGPHSLVNVSAVSADTAAYRRGNP